jgi:hypothetical protein
VDNAPEGVLLRVLGPFEVVVDGNPAPLGGARQRLVLAGLLANANTVRAAAVQRALRRPNAQPTGARDRALMRWSCRASPVSVLCPRGPADRRLTGPESQ